MYIICRKQTQLSTQQTVCKNARKKNLVVLQESGRNLLMAPESGRSYLAPWNNK